EKKDALYIFGTAVMSLALSYLLGQFYYHQPPFMQYETIIQSQPENSFPSQHTAILFGTAFSLLWRRYRKSGALLSIAAVLTGIARIYIGEHFLVDIVGGVAAALAGLGILFLGRSRFDPHISWLAAKAQALEDRVRQTLLGRAV
ncbi:MAG: phosphatase PAP2 family protein, partial [Candidatus Nanohaloarchaea archaeon]|nr:phosphatase PAP2 family protein [Candidatus Nanohaloarchaea archaeon]